MLTEHQKQKAGEILNLTINNKFSPVVLQGHAGTGKTFLADYLIHEIMKHYPGKKVYCCAPTHKAVSVIQNKVKYKGDIEFITAHKALKMKKSRDRETGKLQFAPYEHPKYPIFKGVGLLVIDEASMINNEMLGYIEQYARKQRVIVLYLGDNKQINPVGEEDSPVFTAGYPVVSLSEIIRQGEGNPIIDLSMNLDLIKTKEDRRVKDTYGYIFSNFEDKVVQTLADVNGTDELKFLAWQNDEVDRLNGKVRERIYGKPKLVEEGETLIFDAPYATDDNNMAYHTNEEMKLEEIHLGNLKTSFPETSSRVTNESTYKDVEFKVYRINPGERGLSNGVLVLHEDSIADFKKVKNIMYRNAIKRSLEWNDYHKFIERFAQVKYNHAITIHKSQGSTYQNTIVNIHDINKNFKKKEKQRLLYTAVTRASDLLILFKV